MLILILGANKMETIVTVNIKVNIPIRHLPEAVESFVEKLARDTVVDTLHAANKRISIEDIKTSSTGLIPG